MPTNDFGMIFAALSAERARYLVVGGVAVVLHGHPRFTADLDLVVALDEANALSVIRALSTLGYRPRAPVAATQFADASTRRVWIEEKRLTVLSFWSDQHPATEIDLFVEEPFPFEPTFERALDVDLDGTSVRLISLEDLIELKRRAGRPKDLEDVRALLEISSPPEGP